jgi:hypothetical protein
MAVLFLVAFLMRLVPVLNGAGLLEGLTNACLIVALLLVLPSEGRTDRPWRSAVAGVLLGTSTGIKIWGPVIALVVIIWAVVARRHRDAGLIALGTAAGG